MERNGSGLAVLSVLRERKYENLYWHEKEEIVAGVKTKKRELGWRTTPLSKPLLFSEFNTAIKTGAFISYDEQLWKEISSVDSGLKGANGQHDDTVIAAALANLMRSRYKSPIKSVDSLGRRHRDRSRRSSRTSWTTNMAWSKS